MDLNLGVLAGPARIGNERGLDSDPRICAAADRSMWVVFHDVQSIYAASFFEGNRASGEPDAIAPLRSGLDRVALAAAGTRVLAIETAPDGPGAIGISDFAILNAGPELQGARTVALGRGDHVAPMAASLAISERCKLAVLFASSATAEDPSVRCVVLDRLEGEWQVQGTSEPLSFYVGSLEFPGMRGGTFRACVAPGIGMLGERVFALGIRRDAARIWTISLCALVGTDLAEGGVVDLAFAGEGCFIAPALAVDRGGMIHLSWFQRTRERYWRTWYAAFSEDLKPIVAPAVIGEEFALEFGVEQVRQMSVSEHGVCMTWCGVDDQGPALWIARFEIR